MQPSLSRARLIALGIAPLLAFGFTPAASAAPETLTLTATPADAFVDTIGVNVHLNYTDTVYGDQAGTKAQLLELGIRNIRDGVKATNTSMHTALRSLRDAGIRATLIVDPAGRYGAGTLAEQIAALKDPNKLQGVASLLEGPNELDCTGTGWEDRVRTQQRQLADALAVEPMLRDLPLLGPSWCRGNNSVRAYGADGTASDAWNLHPYPGGYMPEAETGGQVGGEAGISGQKAVAQSVENQPVYATETGYHNATACNGGGHNPTSEAAAGIYGPRLSLEYHRLGVVKGYFYELRNERSETALCDREQHFGLTRYDGSRKPIFNALKNTIATFADTGPRAPNRQFSFTIDGRPTNLRMMAFTRSTGGTQLALWRAQSVWDPINKVTLADPKATFRITLPAATTVSTINLVTGARVDLGTRSVFDLTVGAEVIVVNLGQISGNPPPAYTVDVGASTESASYYTGSLGTHTNSVTTLPEAIRTTRYGPNLTYTLPTGGYAANVTVRYIEPTFTAPGWRVFDVTSDGRLLEDNLDLFVAGGNQRNVVIERTYRLTPGTDGAVHLTGTSSVDNAIFAELVVTPVL